MARFVKSFLVLITVAIWVASARTAEAQTPHAHRARGYFAAPGSAGGLLFYPVNPCRISDTRNAAGALGGPVMAGGVSRDYPVISSSCGLPSTAKAYSLNATVIPRGALAFLSLWAAGQV